MYKDSRFGGAVEQWLHVTVAVDSVGLCVFSFGRSCWRGEREPQGVMVSVDVMRLLVVYS
jgi:hypothetical protein